MLTETDARDVQFRIWASWTPAQKARDMGRLSASVLALRDIGLRERHPEATDEEFRRLRIEATLAASPSLRG